MKKLLVLLLFVPLIAFSQVQLHEWNDSYYSKYNYSTFPSLSVINQKIDVNNIDYALFNAAIFYCTNIQRIRYSRNPFIHSPSLEKAAQDHSKDMVIYNFYSHTSPVIGKRSMSDRLRIVGISNTSSAENIYDKNESEPTYWSFALSLVDGWMDSPGHRDNILNSNLTYLGCGTYYYKNLEWENYFWVKSTQNFSSGGGTRETNNNNNQNTIKRKVTNIPNSIKNKPYKFLIKPGASFYSDISQFEDGDKIFNLTDLSIDNNLYSILLGYRKVPAPSNNSPSKSGRDNNRGDIYGVMFNYGVLSDYSYNNLNSSGLDFKELHIVYSWKEFFRISYGHGTYLQDEILYNLTRNYDYKVISSGVNLRFGRITTEFNISLLSDDDFQSVYNRIDIGLGLNLYLIK